MTVKEQYELMDRKGETPSGFDPIAVYVNGTRIDNAYHPNLWEAEVDDYDIDEEDGCVRFEAHVIEYKGDKRSITLEDLEKALCERYGWSQYDRECGCSTWEGGWFSIDEVLKTVERSEYLD